MNNELTDILFTQLAALTIERDKLSKDKQALENINRQIIANLSVGINTFGLTLEELAREIKAVGGEITARQIQCYLYPVGTENPLHIISGKQQFRRSPESKAKLAEWDKANRTGYRFRFNNQADAEVVKFLDLAENKNDALRKVILFYLAHKDDYPE